MLEPSEVKVGGPEKVFRVYEEWGGNVLLTEKTCQPPMLGKLHSKLRQFTGYAVTQLIKYGILWIKLIEALKHNKDCTVYDTNIYMIHVLTSYEDLNLNEFMNEKTK